MEGAFDAPDGISPRATPDRPMILYTLACAQGHEFEGWFRDSEACEEQLVAGVVECPMCGDSEVAKALMTPGIGGAGREKSRGEPSLTVHEGASREDTPREGPADEGGRIGVVGGAGPARIARQLRRFVEDNFEDVGERFPDEARRIHYGEAEERAIYGVTTTEEAADLADEGVPVGRLPWPGREDA